MGLQQPIQHHVDIIDRAYEVEFNAAIRQRDLAGEKVWQSLSRRNASWKDAKIASGSRRLANQSRCCSVGLSETTEIDIWDVRKRQPPRASVGWSDTAPPPERQLDPLNE